MATLISLCKGQCGRKPLGVTKLGEFSPLGRWFTLGVFLNFKMNVNFWLLYSMAQVKYSFLTKYGLGYILHRLLFTNSSGQPGGPSYDRELQQIYNAMRS
jgi:hypothetical protein